MNQQTEEMKLALEEMKIANYNSAAERLEAALAQPQQEPVAWRLSNKAFDYQITSYDEEQANTYIKNGWHLIDVLYTSPPAQRKPLTDEEKLALLKKHFNAVCVPEWFDALLLDIEAAHGIKETT